MTISSTKSIMANLCFRNMNFNDGTQIIIIYFYYGNTKHEVLKKWTSCFSGTNLPDNGAKACKFQENSVKIAQQVSPTQGNRTLWWQKNRSVRRSIFWRVLVCDATTTWRRRKQGASPTVFNNTMNLLFTGINKLS